MSSLITTPMYYVNGKPHIGHAYSSIVADFLARWRRLTGEEVLFVTGTDEHGQKIKQVSASLGKTPIELCNEMSGFFQNLCTELNLSQDIFVRTTNQSHKIIAQELWKKLDQAGYIYKGKYEGWYAVRDEAYYNENDLIEKDGKKLAPTGAPVEWLEEESYFFKLSEFQKPLLKFYHQHQDFIYPKFRYNEVLRFVEDGLKDLCISRCSMTWGVEVPEDSDHVMYVWLEALSSYISALSYPDGDLFKKFWLQGNQIHVIGKDILRFHAVYWIAFLMAADLPCPKQIVSHGWWQSHGEKISKSLGNTIDPVSLVEIHGTDYLRYFLLREAGLGTDGNFSQDLFQKRTESDLADNLGNLVHRTLSIIKNHCDGKVADCESSHGDHLMKTCQKLVEDFRIKDAIVEVVTFLQTMNKYVDEKKPWVLAKDGNKEELQKVLSTVIKALRQSVILLQPVVPHSASKLLDMLSVPENQRSFAHYSQLNGGGGFPNFEIVFKKLEK